MYRAGPHNKEILQPQMPREVENTAGSKNSRWVKGVTTPERKKGGLEEQERKAGEVPWTGADRLGSPDQLCDLVQVAWLPEPLLPCL